MANKALLFVMEKVNCLSCKKDLVSYYGKDPCVVWANDLVIYLKSLVYHGLDVFVCHGKYPVVYHCISSLLLEVFSRGKRYCLTGKGS